MKKESIIIDIGNAVLMLPNKYSDWFININNDKDKIELSMYIIDSLILSHIDILTEHNIKLFTKEPYIVNDDLTIDLDMDMILGSEFSDIFPNIKDIYEFIYDYPWNVYSVLKFKNSRIIIREEDWRVIEYYRLTNKIDKHSICINEWSDDFSLVNEFIQREN